MKLVAEYIGNDLNSLKTAEYLLSQGDMLELRLYTSNIDAQAVEDLLISKGIQCEVSHDSGLLLIQFQQEVNTLSVIADNLNIEIEGWQLFRSGISGSVKVISMALIALLAWVTVRRKNDIRKH
jgi:hypothetical protein